MRPAHFKLGMSRIEAALQGKFDAGFMDYLWGQVKDAEDHEWEAAVQQTCKSLKKPNQLVAQEFIASVSEARSRARQQRNREEEVRQRERIAAEPPEDSLAMWRRIRDALKAEAAPESALAFCEQIIDRLASQKQPEAKATP